ncbi:hypothetical protein S245_042365, partial [Arachis hypogaea]
NPKLAAASPAVASLSCSPVRRCPDFITSVEYKRLLRLTIAPMTGHDALS